MLISKRVLSELLMEKKNKYSQEKQLMKLDDLTLVLWPVQGLRGWNAYRTIAEQHAKVPSKRVRFEHNSNSTEAITLAAKQPLLCMFLCIAV